MSLFWQVPVSLSEFRQDILNCLSPFCSSRVTVSRPCHLSEFTPRRALFPDLKSLMVELSIITNRFTTPWWSKEHSTETKLERYKRKGSPYQRCWSIYISIPFFCNPSRDFWVCFTLKKKQVTEYLASSGGHQGLTWKGGNSEILVGLPKYLGACYPRARQSFQKGNF